MSDETVVEVRGFPTQEARAQRDYDRTVLFGRARTLQELENSRRKWAPHRVKMRRQRRLSHRVLGFIAIDASGNQRLVSYNEARLLLAKEPDPATPRYQYGRSQQ